MIQGGVNPRIIERKLNSFLPPEHRAMYYDKMVKDSKQRAAAKAQGGE
jgi:flagellar motor component MotA